MSTSDKPTEEGKQEEPQVFAVHTHGKKTQFTRRHFIEMAAASATVATVVGCGGGGDPESTAVPDLPTSAVDAPEDTAVPSADTAVPPTDTPVPPTDTPVPPTDTPVPTDTPTPSKTPSPTPTPIPQVTIDLSSVNVRSGPSTLHPVVVVQYQGDTLEVVSRLEDSSWFKVKIDNNTSGWISESVVKYDFNLADIPVERNVPTPPPPPSPTTPPQPTAPPGTPGEVPEGQTGINYQVNGQTYTLPCGSPIPAGAVCTCNCVSVPSTCTCDQVCTCDTVCSCAGASHYWHPN